MDVSPSCNVAGMMVVHHELLHYLASDSANPVPPVMADNASVAPFGKNRILIQAITKNQMSNNMRKWQNVKFWRGQKLISLRQQ